MNLSVARQTGPAEIARVGESPEIREIVKRSKVSCWPDARNFRRISTYFVGARRWRPVKWNEGSFHHTAKSSGGVPLRQNRSRDIYPSFYMLSSSSIGGRSRSRLALNQVFQLAFTRVPIPKSDKSLSLSFFFLSQASMRFDFKNGDILRWISARASLRKARGKVPHLPFHKITSSFALRDKAKRSFKISFLREEKAYKPRYPIYRHTAHSVVRRVTLCEI